MSICFHWLLGLVDLTSERVARIFFFGEYIFALLVQYLILLMLYANVFKGHAVHSILNVISNVNNFSSANLLQALFT
jgi:hypothetical protein